MSGPTQGVGKGDTHIHTWGRREGKVKGHKGK